MSEKSPVQEMLEKVDFYELVSRRVTLHQTKPHNYKGLSPLTVEKTPSFFVNTRSKTWYDFSSGIGGGVIDYVMRTESLEKGAALSFLGDLTGVKMDVDSPHSRLREIMKEAFAYYTSNLDGAVEYMASRGFSRKTLVKYNIGYAPRGDQTLISNLMDKGYTRRELVEGGIASDNRGAGKALAPFFQDRVVFPLTDAYGSVVSFSGRKLGDRGVGPKYMHGRTTPIYRRNQVVWNLNKVRDLVASNNMVIACEGQMDALAVSGVGLPGVALLGASPSLEQMRLLAGASQNIYLVFDSDQAGERALLSSFEVAEQAGVDALLHAVILPEGEDPHSYMLKYGHEKFRELLAGAYTDTSVLIRSLIRESVSPRKTKAQVAHDVIRKLTPYITSKISYRTMDLIERASQEFSLNQTELRKLLESSSRPPTHSEVKDIITLDAPIYERRILYALLDDPSQIKLFQESSLTLGDFESFLVSKAVGIIRGDMDSLEVFDALKEGLEEEEYYTILEFYSKGLTDVSLEFSLGVMKGIVYKREREANAVDFLGRRIPDSDHIRERRRELKERIASLTT